MNTIETGPSNNARDSEVWSRSWTHFRVDRRSPRYCHVTFDHPPINTITATTVAELVLACDLRFASRENTLLGQWEVGVGVVPVGGPMARLARLVGRGRALEI